MKPIVSFIQEGHRMIPIEVEISLIAGLPRVEFTGLADTSIKECITRLRSAFSKQNFQWPKKYQIIINLRPAYIKKNSSGLDLAIAYAILLKTNQIRVTFEQLIYIYGEVTLDGFVEAPEDLFQIEKQPILTGNVRDFNLFQDVYSIETLKDLSQPKLIRAKPISEILKKPQIPKIRFSKNSAKILEIVASGEHSILLAGEPGSGKTTLAHHIQYLLLPPEEQVFFTARSIARRFGNNLNWRPFVCPHHSTPSLSMIGGGFPPFLGEISKAHGGILFLDEYLEFQSKVQDALREPVEKGVIFISRKGESVSFPALFLLVAATNLCPCGAYVPGKESFCGYSLKRCRSRLERLNGPMLDRFDILALSTFWKGNLDVEMEQIAQNIDQATSIRKKREQIKMNGKLSWSELSQSIDPFILQNLMPSDVISHRRKTALLRVARTIADLNQKQHIEPKHIEEAISFTLKPFNQLLLGQ